MGSLSLEHRYVNREKQPTELRMISRGEREVNFREFKRCTPQKSRTRD